MFHLFHRQNCPNITAFHEAARFDRRNDILSFFLSIDSIDIDFQGRNDEGESYFKWTALHHAVEGGAIENVKTLIAFGASTSIENDKNETPLQLAMRKDNREEIAHILENAEKVIDFSIQIIVLSLNLTNNYHTVVSFVSLLLFTFHDMFSLSFQIRKQKVVGMKKKMPAVSSHNL